MNWIKITKHEDKPNYYESLVIFTEGKILYDWHRLSDGDDEYYASLNTNLTIDGSKVTHYIVLPLIKPPTE